MPHNTIQERREAAQKKSFTTRRGEFNQMRGWFPDRLHIVGEGDSWFAYPSNWILWRKQTNLVEHLSKQTKGKANFLSLAANGDEAVDMVSGSQKHRLIEVLRWHHRDPKRRAVDLLLFSGGGNDVVGKHDFERFLVPYTDQRSAAECVHLPRLQRKAKQIAGAFEELLDIRDHFSPETVVMTHTYDYPYPSNTGGIFLGGLIKTKAWMKRFMDEVGIPEAYQADIIRIFMDELGDRLVSLGNRRAKFDVVDTRGTLKGKKDWLNEIHPTSAGFGEIAAPLYAAMQSRFPRV